MYFLVYFIFCVNIIIEKKKEREEDGVSPETEGEKEEEPKTLK